MDSFAVAFRFSFILIYAQMKNGALDEKRKSTAQALNRQSLVAFHVSEEVTLAMAGKLGNQETKQVSCNTPTHFLLPSTAKGGGGDCGLPEVDPL
jgi:hypothetical protein